MIIKYQELASIWAYEDNNKYIENINQYLFQTPIKIRSLAQVYILANGTACK